MIYNLPTKYPGKKSLPHPWWAFYKDTQPDMYEYGTSRAAAWDCPITMMENIELFKSHPRTDDIFEVLRRW